MLLVVDNTAMNIFAKRATLDENWELTVEACYEYICSFLVNYHHAYYQLWPDCYKKQTT